MAETRTAEKYHVAQQVSATMLDHLLADPELQAVWWEGFNWGTQQNLEDNGAEQVTPWDWWVEELRCTIPADETEDGIPHEYHGYTIHGTCRAVRK